MSRSCQVGDGALLVNAAVTAVTAIAAITAITAISAIAAVTAVAVQSVVMARSSKVCVLSVLLRVQ